MTMIDDSTGFDEPAEQAPATNKAALAITDDIGRIGNAVSEFDRVSAGLAAIEAQFPKDAVYDLTTTKGMKDALAHRAAWRDPRITVEKVRKMAKAPLLALGKNIDARAAWLTERLLEGETPIDQQIKAEEARREAEKEAKAAAEFGRVLAIQEALANIGIEAAAACNKTSEDIVQLLDVMQSTQPDPLVFQEMIEQAKAAWAAAISKLETAHKAKLWEEREAARIAAEQEAQRAAAQAAAEALERQRIENERIAAEQQAERDRLAAERAVFERQQAEFRAQQEAAAAAERARADEAARLEREQRQARELQEARERSERAEAAQITQDAQESGFVAGTPALCVSNEAEPAQASPSESGAAVQADQGTARSVAPAPEVRTFTRTAPAAAHEQFTVRLGEIQALMAPYTVTAEGLAQQGFPAHVERGLKLYRRSDVRAIFLKASKHFAAKAEELLQAA